MINLYTIYDRLAEEAGPLFQAVNDGVALRNYNSLLKDVVDKEDFDCICVGEFDTHTMSIKLIEPRSIIRGE